MHHSTRGISIGIGIFMHINEFFLEINSGVLLALLVLQLWDFISNSSLAQ